MKRILFLVLACIPFLANSANDDERTVINLNGTWLFGSPIISRRFLKIGQAANYSYFNINPKIK